MQTAIQILRENILQSSILSKSTKIIIKAFIEEQLENEKQQIIDACNHGFNDYYPNDGESYFDEKFN